MNPWGFFDDLNIKIWCICLIERDDRFQRAKKEFKKVKLLRKVNFYRPQRNLNSGRDGCFLSHEYCIRESLIENKHALVFEDDVVFTDDWLKKINYLQVFLRTCSSWDIIRLGCAMTSIHRVSKYKKFVLCKSYCTHALIYNVSLVKKLLLRADFNPTVHIDDFLHDEKNIKEFALVDQMCLQKGGLGSDISWSSANIVQKTIEKKNIYEPLQMLNNKQIWYIKRLPIKIQEYLGIFSACLRLIIIFKIYSKIKDGFVNLKDSTRIV